MALIQPEGQITWGGAVLPRIETLDPRIRKAIERPTRGLSLSKKTDIFELLLCFFLQNHASLLFCLGFLFAKDVAFDAKFLLFPDVP